MATSDFTAMGALTLVLGTLWLLLSGVTMIAVLTAALMFPKFARSVLGRFDALSLQAGECNQRLARLERATGLPPATSKAPPIHDLVEQ